MEVTKLKELNLKGLKVRTTNQAEMNPESAKIGNLWQEFYAELNTQGKMPNVSYGVYTNYESDQNGAYDLIVGSTEELKRDDLVDITIPEGKYLKFEKEGPLPETAMQLWQEIWGYFESNKEIERSFSFDFEEYSSMTNIAVYIGVN